MFLNGPFGYLWAFVDGRKLVARRPHPGLTLESFFFSLSLSLSFFFFNRQHFVLCVCLQVAGGVAGPSVI